jgi:hypothetical protein
VLNLGGGIRPGDGVAQFKQRFGPKTLPLRSIKQVYQPETFSRLCGEVKADPNGRHDYFPPYRRASDLVDQTQ